MNLPETTTDRKPRSVNERRAHQCTRPGWRPRKRSPHQQASIIAESIRQHRAAGDSRWTEPREFTPNPETRTLVRQLLLLDERPSRAETCGPHGPALNACEATTWQLRFTRVTEQDDPACVECGTPLEVGDLAIILDTQMAVAIWCSTDCAETLARVERGTKRDISRRVPALSTLEAAAVVLGIIEARLEDGWSLEQIAWQQYCRDSAVIQVVAKQLSRRTYIAQEV